MLFKDLLDTKVQELRPEFDLLLNAINSNQSHNGDLLLVLVNGHFNSDVLGIKEKVSPYVIGPNKEGQSDYLHFEFIRDYQSKSILDTSFDKYLESVKWTSERREEIDKLVYDESISIQQEMLIYLKIWEADYFIKKWYQLVKLLNGEPYDWHFKIAESNRDKNCTGKREEIIRLEIRDKLSKSFPNIYNAFKVAYKTQIRNSIAHSKYSFQGRNIHPNNFISKDHASQIKSLSFNDWIEMSHYTITIYAETLRLFNYINKYYALMSEETNSVIEVRINRKHPKVDTKYALLKYREFWNDWRWDS